MSIIDVDQHIYEPRTMWGDHIDPAFRDDALAIEDDELGYAWLTWRGRRIYPAEVQFPGKAKRIGDARQRAKRGEPAEIRYDDEIAPEYYDAKARVQRLDEWGIDEAVLLPNFGLDWEGLLSADPAALTANMRAYNRWIAGVVGDGGGRLHGVAHLTLQDGDWLREELRTLARAGITLAMVGPSTVNGVALGDPRMDEVWRAFTDANVAPIFHVGSWRQPFDPAWLEGDPEPVDKLINSTMLWVAPALALANMITRGALERHPTLRVGVIELTAHWVPQWMLMMDGAWGFYEARHGEPMHPLPMRPSEYFRRQVKVGALAYEQPAKLIETTGEDTFMFGSDWPHAEGIAKPLETYEAATGPMEGDAKHKLYGDNAAWLLGKG